MKQTIEILLLFAIIIVNTSGFNSPSLLNRHHAAGSTSTKLMSIKSTPNTEQVSRRSALLSSFATALTVGMSLPPVKVAHAAEGSRTIGQISGSGLVFKDTLVVEAFDDPKVRGVTLYISNFERPLNERLQKDFFNEPSYASVTCVKTGKQIEIADNIDKSKAGEPVFEEKRSLLFKELRVQRIYDEEKQTIVYVSFNTRLDKNSDTNKSRFKTSISAISLE
jgi:catabolite regulation protein CreA